MNAKTVNKGVVQRLPVRLMKEGNAIAADSPCAHHETHEGHKRRGAPGILGGVPVGKDVTTYRHFRRGFPPESVQIGAIGGPTMCLFRTFSAYLIGASGDPAHARRRGLRWAVMWRTFSPKMRSRIHAVSICTNLRHLREVLEVQGLTDITTTPVTLEELFVGLVKER